MEELSSSSDRTNARKYMLRSEDSSSVQIVSRQNSNKNIESARRPLLATFEDHSSADHSEQQETFPKYKGAYFRDGQRSIDMVLVFHSKRTEYDVRDTKRRQKREKFINELIRNGLEIETETAQHSKDDIFFVKLYAPLTTLQKKAEDMKLKLPFSLLAKRPEMDVAITSLPFTGKDDKITSHNYRYFLLTPFVRQHADKFLAKGECFSILHRITVVERILNETCFSERKNEFGIKALVNQHVFTAVYPPHEHENYKTAKHAKGRQKLAKDWATFRSLYKKQPMNTVKSYLGTSITFYFIWLGFITQYLWPLAALSIMVLIYGGLTVSSYAPVKEICGQNNITKFLMCPQCDKQCDFWYLSEVCNFTKVAHVFDNDMTVILAFLVSIWSLFLIKFWNRHHSKLVFQWQTYEIEATDEASRPEYVAKVSTTRRNIATGELEQYIPFGTKCGRYALVIVVVVFMICVVLATLLGVVIYRATVYTTLITHAKGGFDKHARVITDITAGVITLISINILSYVYTPIAQRLTNWETPRTQSQWEHNFTYKMFIFQFVNWYSSLFYIAFFKTEHFTGVPGDHTRYTKHGYRLEGCPIEGCSIELCIQLGVIMIGQMFLQNITEICKPYLMKWFAIRKYQHLYNSLLPWQQEYFLTPSHETLFWEYMEIVLQLGFVMMFTAAFPLAALIAFINATFEIRLDAIKFIHFQRRPLPKMATCSGAWQNILEQFAEWSVLVNALVIAMTTDFIPKLVYRFSYSNDYSLNGYINNSLSYFNTSWFPKVEKPVHAMENHNHQPTFCRYPGYHEINGDYSLQYWHVLAMRIIFVMMFYYVITSLRTVLNWMVADEPWQVEARRKRTIYFIKRLFKHKTKRSYGAEKAA